MPQLILLDAARKIFKEHGFTGNMLEQAIPYVKEFKGKLMVLKIGGSIIDDEETQREFIDDVAFMTEIGIKLVLVHGGGKHLTAALHERGVSSTFVHGLRVTTPETIDAARDVFTGINHAMGRALLKETKVKSAVFNAEAPLLWAEIKDPELGLVGEPCRSETEEIRRMVTEGFVPIIPSLAGQEGKPSQLLNINGDTVAGFLARELKAEKLILMTDVDGICNAEGELISTIDQAGVEALIGSGVIRGGMIPKVRTCLDALRGGIGKAHIINGSGRTFVNEVLTDKGVGTQILPA